MSDDDTNVEGNESVFQMLRKQVMKNERRNRKRRLENVNIVNKKRWEFENSFEQLKKNKISGFGVASERRAECAKSNLFPVKIQSVETPTPSRVTENRKEEGYIGPESAKHIIKMSEMMDRLRKQGATDDQVNTFFSGSEKEKREILDALRSRRSVPAVSEAPKQAECERVSAEEAKILAHQISCARTLDSIYSNTREQGRLERQIESESIDFHELKLRALYGIQVSISKGSIERPDYRASGLLPGDENSPPRGLMGRDWNYFQTLYASRTSITRWYSGQADHKCNSSKCKIAHVGDTARFFSAITNTYFVPKKEYYVCLDTAKIHICNKDGKGCNSTTLCQTTGNYMCTISGFSFDNYHDGCPSFSTQDVFRSTMAKGGVCFNEQHVSDIEKRFMNRIHGYEDKLKSRIILRNGIMSDDSKISFIDDGSVMSNSEGHNKKEVVDMVLGFNELPKEERSLINNISGDARLIDSVLSNPEQRGSKNKDSDNGGDTQKRVGKRGRKPLTKSTTPASDNSDVGLKSADSSMLMGMIKNVKSLKSAAMSSQNGQISTEGDPNQGSSIGERVMTAIEKAIREGCHEKRIYSNFKFSAFVDSINKRIAEESRNCAVINMMICENHYKIHQLEASFKIGIPESQFITEVFMQYPHRLRGQHSYSAGLLEFVRLLVKHQEEHQHCQHLPYQAQLHIKELPNEFCVSHDAIKGMRMDLVMVFAYHHIYHCTIP